MAAATTEELERFRRQWQEEVKSRGNGQVSTASKRASFKEQKSGGAGPSRAQLPPQKPQSTVPENENDWEYGYHDLENKNEGRKLGDTNNERQTIAQHEPSSALEHYEKAVERESEGSLGDSLKHYRTAYRVCSLLQENSELPH